MRHGYTRGSYVATNWVLEGSYDRNIPSSSSQWHEIHRVTNFPTASWSSGNTHTWNISPTPANFYHHLRIRCTSKNSDNSWTFCLNGVEFYGDLAFQDETNVLAILIEGLHGAHSQETLNGLYFPTGEKMNEREVYRFDGEAYVYLPRVKAWDLSLSLSLIHITFLHIHTYMIHITYKIYRFDKKDLILMTDKFQRWQISSRALVPKNVSYCLSQATKQAVPSNLNFRVYNNGKWEAATGARAIPIYCQEELKEARDAKAKSSSKSNGSFAESIVMSGLTGNFNQQKLNGQYTLVPNLKFFGYPVYHMRLTEAYYGEYDMYMAFKNATWRIMAKSQFDIPTNDLCYVLSSSSRSDQPLGLSWQVWDGKVWSKTSGIVVASGSNATVITCPGKHGLTKFQTPVANYGCDVCKKTMPARATMHGCRSCNYDVCESCYSKKKGSTKK